MGGEIMKNRSVQKAGLLLAALMLLIACTACGWEPDNIPYEPDTPAPAPHDGLFVSEHGTMTFSGDGESIVIDFDEELAALVGLPAGEQEGMYVFLSGDLPPHGSMPSRYDVAHELRITVGEQSSVIAIGIASEDGKTAVSGTGIVTPARIPMLFRGDRSFSVVFRKEGSIHSIERFFFTESYGSNYDDAVHYELNSENGSYTAVVKPEGVKEEKARTVAVDADFVEKLANVLNEHDVPGWNGFDERDPDIMDGIGFFLRVVTEDGAKVEAVGYMEWPDGYNEAAAAIHNLFESVYKKR